MNKEAQYKSLLAQAKALVDPMVDDVANMATLSQLLAQTFGHHWTGFYRVVNDQLLLGPFVGPIACTAIGLGKGVCGTAWQTKATQIVADVHQFEGHIACSPFSNSEIVVPCIRNNEVFAVLDIDSSAFNTFDDVDKDFLEQIVSYL